MVSYLWIVIAGIVGNAGIPPVTRRIQWRTYTGNATDTVADTVDVLPCCPAVG